ncbi:hypothetical protein DFH07DRAFT_951677 [Mycena maculata]|uniref:Uncharacterized protein n=1 Tax=Mycena maculata TaxID=230809 RepID=A0AAD7K1W9_9AGAR|nr:hypothetical protein DFH07DRAFT_951677 [Mycena maculata]
MTYPYLAAMITKALGVEVTFTSAETSGMPAFHAMRPRNIYTSTAVPNPDLVALGAKFGTMEEFIEVEIKKRFGAQIYIRPSSYFILRNLF